MATKQDYYATLGVAKDADADTLKRAYRKMAMQYHPDRNPNDKAAEAKFKEVNEAYDVLKDDQKRGAYDRFGHAAFEQAGGGGGRAGGFGFADAADPGDAVAETDGVRLVVDSVSLDLVRGSQVTYVESLGGAAFRVENPVAASGCGCGSSFAI